jgi:hypothetical protein
MKHTPTRLKFFVAAILGYTTPFIIGFIMSVIYTIAECQCGNIKMQTMGSLWTMLYLGAYAIPIIIVATTAGFPLFKYIILRGTTVTFPRILLAGFLSATIAILLLTIGISLFRDTPINPFPFQKILPTIFIGSLLTMFFTLIPSGFYKCLYVKDDKNDTETET